MESMNRVSHPFRDVDALLEGLERKTPVEALLLDRRGLIDILKRSLAELHERRRRIAGTPEQETVHQIRYWEEVLGWVKDRRDAELILMSRPRSHQGSEGGFGSSHP